MISLRKKISLSRARLRRNKCGDKVILAHATPGPKSQGCIGCVSVVRRPNRRPDHWTLITSRHLAYPSPVAAQPRHPVAQMSAPVFPGRRPFRRRLPADLSQWLSLAFSVDAVGELVHVGWLQRGGEEVECVGGGDLRLRRSGVTQALSSPAYTRPTDPPLSSRSGVSRFFSLFARTDRLSCLRRPVPPPCASTQQVAWGCRPLKSAIYLGLGAEQRIFCRRTS
uniref:Uncharacterized protein n=1 Tax=Plectus sambesii TaxID=2011161 RepID=A0A914VBJ6_9BILA